MGYSVMLLGEKEGFDKKITFVSALDEKEVQKSYDTFVRSCSGVRRDHLPLRCPIRRSPEGGRYELQFDERNLSYNFDSLMDFIARIIGEGAVKAAKILDGGRIGGTAYVVTAGVSKRFDLVPSQEVLGRINRGELAYAEALKSDDGLTVAEYLKKPLP